MRTVKHKKANIDSRVAKRKVPYKILCEYHKNKRKLYKLPHVVNFEVEKLLNNIF